MKAFFRTLKNLFRKYFISGILVLVPIIATIWILKAIIFWADGIIVSFLPKSLHPHLLGIERVPGLGLVITIAIILIVGVFTRMYLGKKLVEIGDKIIAKIPFGNTVYNMLKQILSTAFDDQGKKKFKGVARIEYPKADSYVLAFITGEATKKTSPDPSKKYYTLFVPTTPNPTSGFMLILPEEKVDILNMSIEEASRVIISGGMLSS